MSIGMRVAVASVLVGGWASAPNDRSASVPMSTQRNELYGVNSYEPAEVNRPYLKVRILNPINRRSRVSTQSWIDTAADHCYISRRAADTLGLKLSTQPPVLVYTPAGTVAMHASEVEYELLDSSGVAIGNFPRIKTHFYVNPRADVPYDVVMGQVGFLDRLDSLTLDFRRRLIVLSW